MSATGGGAPEAAASAFPWDAILAFALRDLGWRPRDVWAASPREIAAALYRPHPQAAGRAEFERLIAAYPDRPAL